MSKYYTIKQNGAIVATGTCDPDNFNAGFPDGFEWADPPAPEPQPRQPITKLAYMDRFTDAELEGIYTAAKASVQVEVWLEKFKLATDINLDDPRTISGLQALESAGLLAAGRAAEILA